MEPDELRRLVLAAVAPYIDRDVLARQIARDWRTSPVGGERQVRSGRRVCGSGGARSAALAWRVSGS
ncbi:hypothetical protein [Streptomyces sp. NBC_00158]|uniref:hypothetical protein n=1 Tax=Streptomyces sp. NBC_00158 TaxID=2903627 RepID=UPI002F90E277